MTEVATPAAPEVTPPAPAATPAPAPATTVAPAAAETVTLSKEEHAQLARDAARAASNQRKADLFDRQSKGNHFQPQAPATPPTAEELKEKADAEDRKAERGITAIAASQEFRDVLDADPTLRDLMVQNPLAVLPILAPDALDAEDALNLVKEALNGRKKPATPPAPAPATATPPAPPTGAVTTPGDQTVDEAVAAAKQLPNTENAIAGMIGAKLRQGK